MLNRRLNNPHRQKKLAIINGFIFIVLLSIIFTTTITLALFSDSESGQTNTVYFGNIELDDLTNSFDLVDDQGFTIDKVLPGSIADVKFNIKNTGTADMNARFKISLSDTNQVDPLDTSIITITKVEAFYLDTDGITKIPVSYVLKDFDGEKWYVRKTPLIGNLNSTTNDPPDQITVTYSFPGTMGNEYLNSNLQIDLAAEAIQVANNGDYNDPEDPLYNVDWNEAVT